MAQDIGVNEVIAAIQQHAGIKDAAEVLPYIGGERSPWRGKVRSAVLAKDGHSIGTYCAGAVSDKLAEAGFDMPLDVRALRAISGAEGGWALIHDVAAGRENAGGILSRRLKTYRDAIGQSSNHTAGGSQAQRSDQRHSGANSRTDSSFEQRGGRANDQRSSAPPPRRHDNTNVRQIGDGRRRNQAPPDNVGTEGENTGSSEWDSVKVHGGRAALTLEATVSRRNMPTINIEAAKMKNAEARTYDWENKIILQLTAAELQQMTLLLCGKLQHLKFQNHGHDNDKWFEVERQTGQYAGTIKFAVGQAKELCIVQLTAADLGNVVGLFIRQCSRQMRVEQAALGMALAPIALALNERAQSQNSQRRAG